MLFATSQWLSINIKKIILKFFVVLAIIIGFSFLLLISQAKWTDLEQIMLLISFDTALESEFNVSLSILDPYSETEMKLAEVIKNPHFSLGLDEWDYIGHVSLHLTPNRFVKIGRENSSNLISENCLIQEFSPAFSDQKSVNLFIDYEWDSSEILLEFDQIAFAVLIEDQVVHLQQADFSQIGLRHKIVIQLPIEDGSQQLKICSGNTGDRALSSWIKLFSASSKTAVLNASQQLLLEAEGAQIEARYSTGSGLKSLSAEDSLSIEFDEEINGNELIIDTSFHDLGLMTRTILPIFPYLDGPHTPNTTNICNLDASGFALSFIQEENDSFHRQLTYFLKIDVDGSTDSFLVKNQHNSSLLDLTKPVCTQQSCLAYFFLDPEVNVELENTSFSIKSCDITGACSDLVGVQKKSDCTKLFGSQDLLPILINEIMFNPLGDDRGDWYEGEWIELYNPNRIDLDLAGWRIEDEAGWIININQESCDNNQDVTDSGETVIPALGYLIAFTRGRAIFNNTGDTAFLYNLENELIDQVKHPGSSTEDRTYGRYPDGSDAFYPLMPPTPLAPNQLE